MHCYSCQQRIPDKTRFCAYCGAEVIRQPKVSRHRGAKFPFILGVLVALLCGGILLLGGFVVRRLSVFQQDETISPETASRVAESGLLGLENDNLYDLAYSPGGELLAVASSSGIHLYNPKTLTEAGVLKTDTWVSSLAFAPGGDVLLTGLSDGRLQLWRVSSKALLDTTNAHRGAVHSVAFSPKGATVASTSVGRLELAAVFNGTEFYTGGYGEASVSDVLAQGLDFARDGVTLAASWGTVALLFHVPDRVIDASLLRSLQHDDVVTDVRFSPDGTTLASSSGTTLSLWNASSGTRLRNWTGHDSRINCIAFSPDGQILASGSTDSTIQLWQVSDGTLLQTLAGHSDSVRRLAFTPDGATLTSVSDDGTVRFWRVARTVAQEPQPPAQESPSAEAASPTPLPAETSSATASPSPLPTETSLATASPLPLPAQGPPTQANARMAGLIFQSGEMLWEIDINGRAIQIDRSVISASSDDRYLVDIVDDDIWLQDLDTGERRNLTQTPNRRECCAQWWPSRADVVVSNSDPVDLDCSECGRGPLTVIGIDGQGYRVLDESRSWGPFVLSPDGQSIAYDREGIAWLYRWDVGPEPLNPELFGLAVEKIASPAWSPDGKRLAWQAMIIKDNQPWIAAVVFDLERQTGYVLHPYQNLGRGGWLPAPEWSPDGQWVIFYAEAINPDEGGIWVVSADQPENEHRLGSVNYPVWSSDSHQFAVSSQAAGNLPVSQPIDQPGIWLIDVNTWYPEKTDLPPDAIPVDWVAGQE